jgi:uncharacterized protein (DUF2147 family)
MTICPPMNRILARMAFVLAAAGLPAVAMAEPELTGQWKNPKGSVVVRLGPCGNAICGVVVNASEHAKDTARRGGTPHLIGTRILSGLRPTGDGSFKGPGHGAGARPRRAVGGRLRLPRPRLQGTALDARQLIAGANPR